VVYGYFGVPFHRSWLPFHLRDGYRFIVEQGYPFILENRSIHRDKCGKACCGSLEEPG